jgi:hypothetical protein
MLIWIDSSVLAADLSVDHDACAGIGAIFDAVYRGEHYALGSRQTLATLAEDKNLSVVARKTIFSVCSKISMLGGIVKQISTRINVSHGRVTETMRVSPSEWETPLCDVGAFGIRKTVLLAENIDDARAFEHAARQYQVSSGMGGQVSIEKVGGGGSTTPGVFRNNALDERRWCLCITDSDRLCPSSTLDVTADKCSDIAKGKSTVACYVDIVAREIENILPFAFVSEAVPCTHQDKWDWHLNRLCALRPDAHSFCDIKNGISLGKVFSFSLSTPAQTFWESVVADLKKASALGSGCLDNNECKEQSASLCRCYVTYGFGEKLLESVVNMLDKQSSHQSERLIRHDLNRQKWMEVGRYVFEWACAPEKMRL